MRYRLRGHNRGLLLHIRYVFYYSRLRSMFVPIQSQLRSVKIISPEL